MQDVTNESFQAVVLDSPLPVVVDFWAPWCAPCKTLTPILEATALEHVGRVEFVKVNIDDTDIAEKYGVRGVPTLMMFIDGVPVATSVGAKPKAGVDAFVAVNV